MKIKKIVFEVIGTILLIALLYGAFWFYKWRKDRMKQIVNSEMHL